MDYELVKSECGKLETEIRSISLKLEQLPEGKLICNKNGMWYKWYHTIVMDIIEPIFLKIKERMQNHWQSKHFWKSKRTI